MLKCVSYVVFLMEIFSLMLGLVSMNIAVNL